jgi:hypothetical protein
VGLGIFSHESLQPSVGLFGPARSF